MSGTDQSAMAVGFLLVLARFLPMTLLLPAVGGLRVTWSARLGLAVVFSCMFAPLMMGSAPGAELNLLDAVLENAFRGAAVGGTIRLLVMALCWTGDWLSELAGAPLHHPNDSSGTDGSVTPLGRCYGWLGLLIFWGIGGVPMAVDATLHSFIRLPLLSDPAATEALAAVAAGILSQSFELAVRVGSPVCLSLTAASLAIAMIQRSMPQASLGSVSLVGSWIVLWVALLVTLGSHSEFLAEYMRTSLLGLALENW